MMKQYEIHIGKLIRDKLEEDGRKVEWLANKIYCTQDDIYKVIDRNSTHTAKLWDISIALKTDFFTYMTDIYENIAGETDGIHTKSWVGQHHKTIGALIKSKFDEDGRKVAWFAQKMGCKKRNIYDIFRRDSIDLEQLLRISLTLKTDFFAYFSEYYRSIVNEAKPVFHGTISK
ncbi:MAG: hypothetical protein LBS55_14320 [Prevotellaceae bacterium]|nr:hypothetical protein [Prevotellaceae bacterium]